MKNKFIIAFIFTLALGWFAQAANAQEAKYYALFVAKFTEYIKWPGSANQIVIGVYGNQEVTRELEKFTAKKEKIKIIKISSTADAQKCQLIFLAKSKDNEFQSIKSSIENKEVLLVTENDDFAQQGAGISFFQQDTKLRFKINKKNIESHNLKISGSLLSLAVIV